MATHSRLVQRRVVMAMATVVATSVALAAPNTLIAVVHDDWYRSGGQRYHDIMTWTALREAQALLPSLAFTTLHLDLNPATPHHLRDLLFNSTRTWAAVVTLGGCQVQRAMTWMVQEEEVGRSGLPPVLHVSWETCQGVLQRQDNTVVLADYSVDKRFICLTWLLRAWLTATLYPSAHLLQARLRRSQQAGHTFLADEMMHKCARRDRVLNQRYLQHLQGRTLTVATIHRPPFTFIRRGEDGSVDAVNASGLDIDILNLLQSRLGFKYRMVYSYDDNWGSKLPNGTWNGIVGMVQRQEADLGVAPFTITLAREEAIDFTFPYYYDPAAILIPAPGPIKKVTAFLDPFSSEVWLGILVSFLVLGPTMYLLNRGGGDPQYLYPHNQTHHPRTTTVLGYYWMLSTSLFQQGVVYPMTSASRVVFGAWITAVIALSCAYTGVLISFLTVPRVQEVFSSLHGLPRQNELKWTFRRSSALGSLFLGEGAEGIYREVGTPFESDDSDLVSTDHEGVMKVLQGSHAFIKEKSYLDFAILEEYHRTGRCSLALVTETFFPAAFGWIVQQDNPLRPLFNQEFIRLEETGFFDSWRDKYWPIRNRCGTRDSVSFTKALDFQDFGGPLTILSIGYILSLLSVLVERLWKNFWKQKKSSEEKKILPDKKAAVKKTILAELTKRYGLPGVELKRGRQAKAPVVARAGERSS